MRMCSRWTRIRGGGRSDAAQPIDLGAQFAILCLGPGQPRAQLFALEIGLDLVFFAGGLGFTRLLGRTLQGRTSRLQLVESMYETRTTTYQHQSDLFVFGRRGMLLFMHRQCTFQLAVKLFVLRLFELQLRNS
jgi:hypothetical protein